MSNIAVKIIGIDPAPGKKSTIFDGHKFHDLTISELERYLSQEKINSERLLVAWDAPLTGPSNTERFCDPGASKMTMRSIEGFFKSKGKFKAPGGVSVLPYAGCVHWTISRRVLGLPRVGPFDASESDLPFELLDENSSGEIKHSVIEVHPAVGLWLWAKDFYDFKSDLEYKKDKAMHSWVVENTNKFTK